GAPAPCSPGPTPTPPPATPCCRAWDPRAGGSSSTGRSTGASRSCSPSSAASPTSRARRAPTDGATPPRPTRTTGSPASPPSTTPSGRAPSSPAPATRSSPTPCRRRTGCSPPRASRRLPSSGSAGRCAARPDPVARFQESHIHERGLGGCGFPELPRPRPSGLALGLGAAPLLVLGAGLLRQRVVPPQVAALGELHPGELLPLGVLARHLEQLLGQRDRHHHGAVV